MLALDKGELVLMAFLDLSAAFDVVDHDILLQGLKLSQGIADLPLEWIRSYLQRRTQQVVISDSASSVLELDCAMPQGSIKIYRDPWYCSTAAAAAVPFLRRRQPLWQGM